jgi:hypothetical protein
LVESFCLSFLNANYVHSDHLSPTLAERPTFKAAAKKAARDAQTDELRRLLELDDWHPRLVAAYLVGIDRRVELTPLVSHALAEARYGFAAQGYVFALFRIGSLEARAVLETHASREGIDEAERQRTLAALSLMRGDEAAALSREIAEQRARLASELRYWE